MKESDITPKVIELVKQIAEYWRMEIKRGVWIIDDDDNKALITEVYYDDKVMADYGDYTRYFTKDNPKIFPIPDIGDCEQKLLRLGFTYRTDRLLSCVVIQLYDPEDEGKPYGKETQGVNTHEALLQALLSVLKEEK